MTCCPDESCHSTIRRLRLRFAGVHWYECIKCRSIWEECQAMRGEVLVR